MSENKFLSESQLESMRNSEATVALIDADIPAYSVAFMCEDTASWSIVEKEVDNFMSARCNSVGATHFIGFLTNGGLNYRLDEATTAPYKGNRAGSEKPKWFHKVREYLQTAWKCQVMNGIEADDALAIAHKYFTDNNIKSVLCSLDKDLRQSPGWHYNWKKDELDYVDFYHGQLNLWRQVITGDMGTDNIPGLSESAWKPQLGYRKRLMESYKKLPRHPKRLRDGSPSMKEVAHSRTIGFKVIDNPRSIKAPLDMLYGKERAKEMLPEGFPEESMAELVLNAYVDAYWEDGVIQEYEDPADKGKERFKEVFTLVYMLRTPEEIPNEACINFTPLEFTSQVFHEFDEEEEDVFSDFDDDF